MIGEKFTCARCGGTFEKARPEEEALAEMKANFSPQELAAGVDVVCDDCYQAFEAWLKAHPDIRISGN